MTTVLLCGAFGQDNPGDEALLTAATRALGDHDLIVTGTADVRSGDEGRRLVAHIPPTARAVASALRRSDAVVVFGGTAFKQLHPASGRHPLGLLRRACLLQGAARSVGVPFALVGVGAGTLRSGPARRLARRLVDRADLTVLRDEESAAVLDQAGATGPFRIGADPAWTLVDIDDASPEASDGGVLIAVSHLTAREPGTVVDQLVSMVDHLTSRGLAVSLQPWQGGWADEDAEVARAATARSRERDKVAVIPAPVDLEDAARTCGRHRAVVGQRFHSLIAAGWAQRPFLAIAHEPKLAGLARRLGQLSIPPHAPAPLLAEAVDRVLEAPAPSVARIGHEVELAHQSLALLRLVLGGGADDRLLDEVRTELTSGVPW